VNISNSLLRQNVPLELNCQEQEYYPVVVIQLISMTPVASLDYQTNVEDTIKYVSVDKAMDYRL
jgi:hypothetical protein